MYNLVYRSISKLSVDYVDGLFLSLWSYILNRFYIPGRYKRNPP